MRAASHSTQQPSTPSSGRQNDGVEIDDREVDHRRCACRSADGCRWWTMYSPAVERLTFGCHVLSSRPILSFSAPAPQQRDPVHLACTAPSSPARPASSGAAPVSSASISMTTETPIFTMLPQHEADGAGAGRHAGEPAGHAARHQGPRHHHHRRAIQRRPNHIHTSRDQPRKQGHHHPDPGLHRDHPPRRNRMRVICHESPSLFGRQLLEWHSTGVILVVVPRVRAGIPV